MTILLYIGIFWTGVLAGVFIDRWLVYRLRDYSGIMVVSKDEDRDKTVYSLILDEYPEKLEFKKEIVFRVDTSEEVPDRE
jgi:hypothetical protein